MPDTENEIKDEPYHVKYYRDNKDTISRQKRNRYQRDKKYREKIKKQARARYRKKYRSPDKKIGYTVKYIDGIAVFTVKYVLGVINKSRDFLDNWESKGLIPASTYVDSRGWRLYTQNQIDLLDEAIGNYDAKEWDRETVAAYLHSRWSDA